MMQNTDTNNGRRSGTRRGSALVVVIGALALVAVFAALYVTIGQGDQRIARSVADAREVSEVDRIFARRILRIVGEDRLAAVPEPFIDPNLGGYVPATPNTQRFVREAIDIPYTDFTRRSQLPLSDIGLAVGGDDPWLPSWFLSLTDQEQRDLYGFDPVGDASVPVPNPGPGRDIREDRRVASDPWLASTEPSFIGWRTRPVNSADTDPDFTQRDGRAYSLVGTKAAPQPHAALSFMDHRDWKQISNIAPDGRFVNLFNLRGNFDAEPGIGQDGADHRMTSRLTLLEPIEVWRGSALRATTNLPFGLGDADADGDGFVDDVYLNIPALWTSNQRFMFFPLNQPEEFRIAVAGETAWNDNTTAGWGDYEFPDYQYADADGDGMADSRWFELADASDPLNVVFELPVDDLRFFAAARIVDLSAMVNVNTATDQLTPPTSWSPPGMTPADVDLRRLLRMTDQARDYRQFPLQKQASVPDAIDATWTTWSTNSGQNVASAIDGLSYRHLEQPVGYAQDEGVNWSTQSYFGYEQNLDPALSPADARLAAGLSGAFAYDAIRRSIEDSDGPIRLEAGGNAFFGVPGANNPIGTQGAGLLDASPFEYNAGGGVGLYTRLGSTQPLSLLNALELSTLSRDRLYEAVGSRDASQPDSEETDPQLAGRFGANLFGTDSLSELLAYRGLNDDQRYTRLEQVVGGRYRNPFAQNYNDRSTTLRFSPLRSNRATALERLTHDNVEDYLNVYSAQSFGQIQADGTVDLNTMALFALSPRSRLTTVSGASPIRPGLIYEDVDPGASENLQLWNGGRSDPPALLPIGLDANQPMGENPLEDGDLLRRSSRVDVRSLVDGLLVRSLFDDDAAARTAKSRERRFATDNAFKVYADALLPDSGIENGLAWEDTGGQHLWTLFYGNKGPEPALMAAAHLAVNMKDLADEDHRPTAATVLVDGRNNGIADAVYDQAGQIVNGANRRYAFQWGAGQGGDPSEDGPEPQPFVTNGPTERDHSYVFGPTDDGFIFDLDRRDPLETNSGSINRTNTALHRSNASVLPVARQAVTVFGVEAHPILSEVSSMIVYADANPTDPTEQTIEASTATSNTDVALQVIAFQLHNPFDVPIRLSEGYDDPALFTNPADTTVFPHWDYAIEFNGHYFPVVGYEWNEAQTRYEFRSAGVLLPGQSRVFYAINQPDFQALADRWDQTLAAYGLGALVYPTSAEVSIQGRFFGDQFRSSVGGGAPVFLQRVDTRGTIGTRLTTQVDLFAASASPARANPTDEEVRLWRSYRTGSSDEDATNIGGDEVWIENDILVDRLRDPDTTTDTWDVGLPSNVDIDMVDGVGLAAARPFTITRWATVRRPDHFDEAGTPIDLPTGAVPAYMLERTSGASFNIVHDVLPDGTDLDSFDDFDATSNAYAPDTLLGFFDAIGFTDDLVPINGRAIIPTLGINPDDKGSGIQFNHNADLAGIGQTNPYQGVGASDSPETEVDGAGVSALYVSEIQPELYTDTNEFLRDTGVEFPVGSATNLGVDVLRVTDVLRPLAIGPMHVPGANSAFDPTTGLIGGAFSAGDPAPEVADGEWITLGEALSIALGFEEATFYDGGRNATTGDIVAGTYSPLQDQVQRETGTLGTTPPVRMFDRGQLRLNDYVPFVNFAFGGGVDEARDLPLYQPEFGDFRIGGGSTAAARLLASFTGVAPRVSPQSDPETDHELSSAAIGTVNLNTAPLSVLRTLPGLTPSLEVDSRGVDEWWGTRNPEWATGPINPSDRDDVGLPDPRDPDLLMAGAGHSTAFPNPDLWRQRPDIAATIAAYRDRTAAELRFDSREPFANDDRIDDLTFAPIGYLGVPAAGNAPDNPRFWAMMRNFEAGADNTGAAIGPWNALRSADRGRYVMNGIEGVSERPGFNSVGDLLGVSVGSEDPLVRPGVASGITANPGLIDYTILDFFDLSIDGGVQAGSTRWEGSTTDADRSPTFGLTPDDDAPNIFGVHDIFSLARDGRSLGTRDITGVEDELVVTIDPYLHRDGSGVRVEADEIEDDYDEQLAVLAGLMNTTDVRSDYFAAWFVIRGYRASDVEGLGEDEAMLPTFQKRYLLVLDRSNVVSANDRPRVVLYRELPL